LILKCYFRVFIARETLHFRFILDLNKLLLRPMHFEQCTSTRCTIIAILISKGCVTFSGGLSHTASLQLQKKITAFVKLQNLNTTKIFYIVSDMGCGL
jgi:hypothetical protein